VKPIQYWVDSGAPEDVKRSLLEGRRLVGPGFEAAASATASSRRAARRATRGHPLQHDQLGASLDARLESGARSPTAHRRDHQGDGHARLAARSPGLHDLRGLSRRTPPGLRGRRSSTKRAQADPPARSARVGHTLGLGHTTTNSEKAGSRSWTIPSAREAERGRLDRFVDA